MLPASAFRFSHSLVAVLDASDGTVVDVNPALEQLLGISRAEAIGKRTVELGIWPELETRASIWMRLRSEQRVCGDTVALQARDGRIVHGRIYVEVFESGQRSFALAVIQQIAEGDGAAERSSEQAAIESYRSLFNAAEEGIYRSLPEGGFIDVNPALAHMFGYDSPAQMVSAPIQQAEHYYVDKAEAQQLMEQLDREGRVTNAASRVYRRDGSIITISENMRAIRDAAGRIAFYEGTAVDITERVEAESRLRQSESKYRSLFHHAVTGMFQSHPDGRLLEANDALARMLGYGSNGEMKTQVLHMRQIYARPQDREAVLRQLETEGRVGSFEFPARHRDGSDVLVELNAQLIRDESGEVLYIEGSAQDITARRSAERALQQSEARYRVLVEHSQVGVYMMLEDRYVYVNHAFASMFGYSEQELVGANFRLLVPRESRAHQEDRYQRQAEGLGNGGDYFVTLLRKNGDLVDVVVSAGTIEFDGRIYTTGTIRDVTEQRRVQRQLEHNATHDLLTGLPNRLFFEQRLSSIVADAHALNDFDYAVLFLDLDGFKVVNDSLGHASGDRLLVQIGQALQSALGESVLVTRYGGDEFTLLQMPCKPARAEQLAQRVLTLLSASFDIDGHRIFTGASLGVVLGHADYVTPEQILRDADTAMYRAKARGKSAYVIFDDAMHAAARARLKLETDLRFALERGEFRVYYQPIVDLRSGVVQGCEALVRWQHPERGLLLPNEFLGVAEEAGLVVALDWWVLENTCRNLLRWQRHFPQHARLYASVNMNERQFSGGDLLATLSAVLRRTGIDPSCLSLEITETIFRGGRDQAQARLGELKELGVSLVVDDFGTGYSSLDSFATASFDALKVDRSFISDMATNFRHRAIVRTITGFAEDLGLRLIAEGVETAEQAALLRDLGCTSAQGYLYAPALPVESLERVLEMGLHPGTDARTDAVA